MKNTVNQAIISLLLIFVIFVSCKKEEKEVQQNAFRYNSKEAEIGTALGIKYGVTTSPGVYAINMIFFEKTIIVHSLTNFPDSASGTGDALFLTLLTNNETEVTPGEYTLIPSVGVPKAFVIDGNDDTGLLVNYDISHGGGGYAYLDISSGKVTVTKNGDTYEFTFNLNTTVNSTITGFYKGKVEIFSL
jgi:hypothetical protein